MPELVTVEERLERLEKDVAELKRQSQTSPPRNWFERVSGSMTKYPEFAEVLRLGREIRQADWPNEDEGP